MASRTAYSTWTSQKPTLFDNHYLRNRSTLDVGVLGYIGIVQHKEHPLEVWSVSPVTSCIYMRTCTHAYTYIPKHYIHTIYTYILYIDCIHYLHTNTLHSYINTYNTYIHYIHTYIDILQAYSRIHACTHAHIIHTYILPHIHTYIYTPTHTYIHIYTHT